MVQNILSDSRSADVENENEQNNVWVWEFVTSWFRKDRYCEQILWEGAIITRKLNSSHVTHLCLWESHFSNLSLLFSAGNMGSCHLLENLSFNQETLCHWSSPTTHSFIWIFFKNLPLMCGIWNMIQINISAKQKKTHRHREQACGYHARGWGREGLRVWD